MISSVLTVSQANTFIKSLIEGDGRLNDFFLTGEISNFTDHYRSGHLYFSLKDEKSVIKVVMFSSAASRLKFHPTSGMKVIVRGRISVYEPSGQYQMVVQSMQPEGIGALAMAFEQLKEKLGAEGIFAEENKKPLPPYPKKIGVITSPTGAAVQDILQILGRRWPLGEVVFHPVQVQGETAPAQLTQALRDMDTVNCDVIIIGRGGGSYEDLQAFNDEQLARTIFACHTPVISAVGHETDFTIADFASDLRAPTPSAAAELCTPDGQKILAEIASYHNYFCVQAQRRVEYGKQSLDFLLEKSVLKEADRVLMPSKQKLAEMTDKLQNLVKNKITENARQVEYQIAKLDSLSPLKVLLRGYAVAQKKPGEIVRSVNQVVVGDTLAVRLSDGMIRTKVEEMQLGKEN
ncbi:exodeoxyribonuclease VII large subunit [Scatolibacter rhodanostii]|uniref:exodeoxyribonuclease VII large subunit n=1 Tax=Scatolibacter rhodanostii TaxID=2014781 RepID=UPI000C077B6C|nr:exodeoxyribonuclease VII large subunit [Scatolibacter rhodanostii]